MMQYPWGKGTPKWVCDATPNDSDKSFTVPAGKVWKLLGVAAELKCTATVGTRSLQVRIFDTTPASLLCSNTTSAAPSQNITTELSFGGGISSTMVRNPINPATPTHVSSISVAAESVLPAGYSVRVYDYAAIDAAADDLTVVLHYVEYDA